MHLVSECNLQAMNKTIIMQCFKSALLICYQQFIKNHLILNEHQKSSFALTRGTRAR